MNIVPILTETQIEQKIKRMAYEIWERNSEEKEVTLIGIEPGGSVVAQNLATVLKKISPLKIKLTNLAINKTNPVQEIMELADIKVDQKVAILVDDVANSGKTLLYAIKPLLDHSPKKIQIAVLVDRKHKNFPVTPDIIGHSVSTTL